MIAYLPHRETKVFPLPDSYLPLTIYPHIPSPAHLDYSLLNLESRIPFSRAELDVLNLGAGDGSGNFAQQIAAIPFHRLVNVEIHPDALFTLSHLPYQAQSVEFINADALEYVRALPDKSFDVVLLIDVLEHFTHEQGVELIQHLKRIARRQVLIWLPFGECEQHEYGGNPFQQHQSAWYPSEFQMLGAEVDVCWRHFHIEGAPYAGFVSLTHL